jgi:hypothetical protein
MVALLENSLNRPKREKKLSVKEMIAGKDNWIRYKAAYAARLSFNPLTCYEEMKRYTFRRWLPWGQGNILVLQKTTASLR